MSENRKKELKEPTLRDEVLKIVQEDKQKGWSPSVDKVSGEARPHFKLKNN